MEQAYRDHWLEIQTSKEYADHKKEVTEVMGNGKGFKFVVRRWT